MPTAEYSVYVSAENVPAIEEYCKEHDISASEAFKEAMRNQLQAFEGGKA